MSEYLTQSESIQEIAEAIREASGETDPLVFPGDFASKIRELKIKGVAKFIVPNFIEQHNYISLGIVDDIDIEKASPSLFCRYVNIPNLVSNTVQGVGWANAAYSFGDYEKHLQIGFRRDGDSDKSNSLLSWPITSPAEPISSGSGRMLLTAEKELRVYSNTNAYPFQPGIIICWLMWHDWDDEADESSVDWKVGYALDEIGSEYPDAGFVTTNFITCKKGDFVYIVADGLDLETDGMVAEYTNDGGASYVNPVSVWTATAIQDTSSFMRKFVDGYYCFAVKDEGTAMLRFSFKKLASETKINISVNDPPFVIPKTTT